MRIVAAKAGDDHFPPIGAIVAVGILQKENVRRVGHPHAAGANGKARRNVQALGKDREAIRPAVAIGVFEDLHPVASRAWLAPRIFKAFGDPDPPSLVERHRHRVDDIRLGRDNLDRKALGYGHPRDGFGRRQGRAGRLVLPVRDEILFRRLGRVQPCLGAEDRQQNRETVVAHKSAQSAHVIPLPAQEWRW